MDELKSPNESEEIEYLKGSNEAYEARFISDQKEIAELKGMISEKDSQQAIELNRRINTMALTISKLERIIRALRKANKEKDLIIATFLKIQNQMDKVIDERW